MEDEYTTQEWFMHKSILFYVPNISDVYEGYNDDLNKKSKKKIKVKMALFDMDGTLINSSKGEKYATNATDWVFAYENILDKLLEYKEQGYCLGIISNRKAKIDSKTVKLAQKRVKNIFKELGFECFAFLLTGEGEYRKPGIKVLEVLMDLASIDEFDEESFYCGDAAKGHAEQSSAVDWFQWSDTDYMLVRNWNRTNKKLGELEFYTPDELFGDFPEWETRVSSKVKLVITCGQVGSGYPESKSIYEINDKEFHVGKSSSFKKDYKISNDYVTVISGSFPTFDEREQIREKFNAKKSETLIVWFTRSSLSGLSKAMENSYVKSFQSPEITGEKWIRGN